MPSLVQLSLLLPASKQANLFQPFMRALRQTGGGLQRVSAKLPNWVPVKGLADTLETAGGKHLAPVVKRLRKDPEWSELMSGRVSSNGTMRQLRSAIYANEPPALTEAIKRTGGAQGLLAGSVVGLPLLLAMEKARRELNEHFFANRDRKSVV